MQNLMEMSWEGGGGGAALDATLTKEFISYKQVMLKT